MVETFAAPGLLGVCAPRTPQLALASFRWESKGAEHLAAVAAEPGLVQDELQIRSAVDIRAEAARGDDAQIQLSTLCTLAMPAKAVLSECRGDRSWRRELERVRTAPMTIGRDDDGALFGEEQLEIGCADERQVRREQECACCSSADRRAQRGRRSVIRARCGHLQ